MKPEPQELTKLIALLKQLSPFDIHKVFVYATVLKNIRLEKQLLQ